MSADAVLQHLHAANMLSLGLWLVGLGLRVPLLRTVGGVGAFAISGTTLLVIFGLLL